MLDGQDLAVGDAVDLGARRRQLRADHQLGQLTGVDGGGVEVGRDGRAAADDGDLVGDRQHLVELVGDEDDGEALRLQLAQVVEELGDLLGHQDGGRLVEDEDLGAAEEHLEDLDPLTLADAEVGDQVVRVDAQAVGVGDLDDRPAGVVADAVQLLRAQHDVLEDGEVVGQHEVLEHHPDAGVDRVRRARAGERPAVRPRWCPRRAAGPRRGSSSGSTCRHRSPRRWRARCRAAP